MPRFMKPLIPALFFLFLSSMAAADQSPLTLPSNVSNAVMSAAQSWFIFIDGNKVPESWKETASLFKTQVSQKQWAESMASVQTTFGMAMARQLLNAQYTKTLPGAPDGEYVILQYQTAFEKKAASVETLTVMLDSDGKWRVAGYFIK